MKEFPEAGRVVMAKVDCDKEQTVASRFHISKYPTLKVLRNGQPTKREYRGQRSSDAFLEFVKKQLEDPIKEFHNLRDLETLDTKKRIVIGYFDRRDMPEYKTFRRVAGNLKEDCHFQAGFGDVVETMHPPGKRYSNMINYFLIKEMVLFASNCKKIFYTAKHLCK
jgi:endoplasmic reticulum resident protein 44